MAFPLRIGFGHSTEHLELRENATSYWYNKSETTAAGKEKLTSWERERHKRECRKFEYNIRTNFLLDSWIRCTTRARQSTSSTAETKRSGGDFSSCLPPGRQSWIFEFNQVHCLWKAQKSTLSSGTWKNLSSINCINKISLMQFKLQDIKYGSSYIHIQRSKWKTRS